MRKWMCAVLTALLVAGLTACGGKGADWQERYDAGAGYFEDGDYEESIEAFTDAVEMDAERPEAYLGRAEAYMALGSEENLKLAAEDYEAALELDDSLTEAYLSLSNLYARQGEQEKAQEVLEDGFGKTGDASLQEELKALTAIRDESFTDHAHREDVYSFNGEGDGEVSPENLSYYILYDYNLKGQRTAATSYTPDGQQIAHLDIPYDEDGNPQIKILKSGRGELETMQYRYEDGLLAEASCTTTMPKGDKIENVIRYTYDGQGVLTQTDTYANGAYLKSTEYTYDDDGRLIREESTNGGYREYTYDDLGLTLVSSYDGSPSPNNAPTDYDVTVRDGNGNFLGFDSMMSLDMGAGPEMVPLSAIRYS